jgi:lactate dehydrogenase-like 2-hydroxyacid dehydrogenase
MIKVDVLMPAAMMPHVMDQLEQAFTLHRMWEAPDRASFLAEVGPLIRGIATSSSQINSALFDRLPNLEIVSSFGVGYDHVDAAEAWRRGIVVTNTPDVLNDEVADLTIGLLIATIRQIPQAERYLREGRWLERPFPLSATLRDRKVGIVGLGRIGKAIARRLEGFDIPILYHGRNRQVGVTYAYCSTIEELARESDVLIAITPGGAGTRHLIDANVLKALGPNGILINVARGSVVDESALIEALKSKTILAAGLDVYENEPQVPAELIALDNVVLLPHIASGSIYTRKAMGQVVVDNLLSWFGGRGPMTPVSETPWRGEES